MEKVYSTEYLNSDCDVAVERVNQKFQSKYPDKYRHLDYDSNISNVDILAIEKIFGIRIPKYIEDMHKHGMSEKYQTVRNRYLVNSIRNKLSEEQAEFNNRSSDSPLKNKVQSIGKRIFRIKKDAQKQSI